MDFILHVNLIFYFSFFLKSVAQLCIYYTVKADLQENMVEKAIWVKADKN